MELVWKFRHFANRSTFKRRMRERPNCKQGRHQDADPPYSWFMWTESSANIPGGPN